MNPNGLGALLGLAVFLGFFHTLVGPDHYVPFIMMARARNWTWRWTALITFLCGLGHVLSSVVIGAIGAAIGLAVTSLEAVEASRAEVAAWLLIAFGLLYFAWGLRRAWRGERHAHGHHHGAGGEHEHEHDHRGEHVHVHGGEAGAARVNLTPWILFTIFVFGPCEPLIPILMYPAAQHSYAGMLLVAGAFSLATISTMLAAVLLVSRGFDFLPLGKLERYTHAVAGLTIFCCGAAMKFLGL